MLCFFVSICFSIDLLSSSECDSPKVWSGVQYQCESCTTGSILVDSQCVWNSTYISILNSSCTGVLVGDYCVSTEQRNTLFSGYSTTPPTSTFNSTYYNSFYSKLLSAAYNDLDEDGKNYFANACVLGHYNSGFFCTAYNRIYSSQTVGKFGVQDWPTEGIFLDYKSSFASIRRESLFQSSFSYAQEINLWVGRFTKNGKFVGFEKIRTQLNRCSEPVETSETWREFGFNYYSKCQFSIKEISSTLTTDFFDLFLEDGTTNGSSILRPIPVVDLNRNNNDAVDDYKPSRRFFLYDDYSQNGMVQFANSITLQIEISESDKTRIRVPYMTISYSTRAWSDVLDNTTSVIHNVETTTHPNFVFSVVYSLYGFVEDISNVATIMFTILLALMFFIWIVAAFLTGRTNGEDGMSGSVIMEIAGLFFEMLGLAFFLISWFFATYIWFFFKLQNATHTCLPPVSETTIIESFLWTALVLKSIAALFEVLGRTNFDIHLIDWETPYAEDVSVSTWRRIMIANEWSRMFTIRSYNIPFTLITALFLLKGLGYDLLSSPIPSTELIDVGESFIILRFATISLIFLGLVMVQYIWNQFIYWRFFGNPFLNFLDLCSTSNISILNMVSTNHGFYLHGRSIHSHADEDMLHLNQNLELEASGLVGSRGLLPNTNEQVFEVFFAAPLRNAIKQLYANMQAIGPNDSGPLTASRIPPQSVKAAADLNLFLREFFDQSSKEHPYVVQTPSFLHQVIGLTPPVLTDSIFAVQEETFFKDSLFYGIEWRIMLFYAILFIVIDFETLSPALSAFYVQVIDILVVKLLKSSSKSNISRKSLLDKRFLL